MNLRIYTMIKQAEELASAVNNAAQEDPAAAAPTADAVQADQAAAAEDAPADNGLGELSPTEQKMIQYKRKMQGMAQNAGQQLQTAGNKIGDWLKQNHGGIWNPNRGGNGEPHQAWDEHGMYPGSLKDLFTPKPPQQTGNI